MQSCREPLDNSETRAVVELGLIKDDAGSDERRLFQAGLVINLVNIAGNSVCGSSLLTANRLVTAAHCWFDGVNQAWQFTVVLGTQYLFFGGTRISTSTVITHQQWTPSTLANDVAIIYLPTSVFFSCKFFKINCYVPS